MSAGDDNKQKELQRYREHEEIICQTLNRIPMTRAESKKYRQMVKLRFAEKRFYTAIDYRDKKLLKKQYAILMSGQENTDLYRTLYLRNRYLIWKILYKLKDRWKESKCTKYR